MKVLVIGATGNVGSVVVGELLKRGAEVRALITARPRSQHDGAETNQGVHCCSTGAKT
jgi:uncharacterized protein YbjT (DUF2867 family)